MESSFTIGMSVFCSGRSLSWIWVFSSQVRRPDRGRVLFLRRYHGEVERC